MSLAETASTFDETAVREAYFYPRYVALLRDTGRMTAEDLASRHLGAQIDVPDFWRAAVARLEPRVVAFDAVVAGIA